MRNNGPMLSIVLLVWFMTMTSQHIAAFDWFDCRQQGVHCVGNSTCGTTGRCICDAGMSGYNCAVDNKWLDCRKLEVNCAGNASCDTLSGKCMCPAEMDGDDCFAENTTIGCGMECQNGGYCHTTNGEEECFCPQDYTGDTCELPRGEIRCSGQGMIVHIRPFRQDVSVIVAGEEEGVFCPMNDSADGGYELEAGFDECGGAKEERKAEGIERSFKVIIRGESQIQTRMDNYLKFVCVIPSENATINVNTSMGVIEPAEEPVPDGEFREDIDLPMKLELYKDSQPFHGDVYVNDEISLHYEMLPDLGYDGFLILEISIDNGKEGDEFLENYLLQEGCLTSLGLAVFIDMQYTTGKVSDLALSMFRYIQSEKVNIKSSIRLCQGACPEVICRDESLDIQKGRPEPEPEISEGEGDANATVPEPVPEEGINGTEAEEYPAGNGTAPEETPSGNGTAEVPSGTGDEAAATGDTPEGDEGGEGLFRKKRNAEAGKTLTLVLNSDGKLQRIKRELLRHPKPTDDMRQLNLTLYVQDRRRTGMWGSRTGASTGSGSDACFRSWPVIMVLAVFSVLMFAILVLAIFFFCKASNRRRCQTHPDYLKNIEYVQDACVSAAP